MKERLLRGVLSHFIRPRKIHGFEGVEILLQLQSIDSFARLVPALPFRQAPVPRKTRSAAGFGEIPRLGPIWGQPYLMRQHPHPCFSLRTLGASTSFLLLCAART